MNGPYIPPRLSVPLDSRGGEGAGIRSRTTVKEIAALPLNGGRFSTASEEGSRDLKRPSARSDPRNILCVHVRGGAE
eukprot:CAMPEP_0170148898 /NCGR_PEP_ID=MMETSP0033_2-20121228/40829_1 /TAXON_ID=195969 /ORGANISM="Dolichomastix tenuilepis, Strain CCMP3274" /LENGTH=76 /DNA_ID=CAMNT_0010385817 /DNA_START=46 /DNA_END=273 /DNA_ORIENTATION=+